MVNAHKRYLPGVKLPENINAIPDIETVAKDADILIFNFPHQVFFSPYRADKSLPLKSALSSKDTLIHEQGEFLVLKESM
jgi:glycerol-3-phosphate dehydrogenase